ncbi:MurR/RpiR family transcriptional regulator [Collinsella sp. AGMB00827]|uniref:MurR/RpiR family transcriptional regulator n=1 Tax=Collinsella ureilytica TaxID=2869515 RepID=A0ABS7MKQ4_9ACTN|nr:MurR/RpiR family transcriptional regulator [Collinsella urealyticum]MBY4797661.1 MurR/RpiR family transcriptional regulator [Collinsella urealyticum]
MDELFSYDSVRKFNETDLHIYKYVLAHAQDVTYMSIRHLAKCVSVSTSTILRFCEKVGCEGYAELKDRLREHLESGERREPGGDTREILDYFERTYTAAFETAIARAVEMISSSHIVVFMGQGGSGLLARYGGRYFSGMGKLALSIDDPWYPISDELGEHALVIALSVSGESKHLICQLKDCQRSGARILAITGDSASTAARMADHAISYDMTAVRSSSDANLTSQVPVIYIIEVLARRWHESQVGKLAE